jgi:hypothetical protein
MTEVILAIGVFKTMLFEAVGIGVCEAATYINVQKTFSFYWT